MYRLGYSTFLNVLQRDAKYSSAASDLFHNAILTLCRTVSSCVLSTNLVHQHALLRQEVVPCKNYRKQERAYHKNTFTSKDFHSPNFSSENPKSTAETTIFEQQTWQAALDAVLQQEASLMSERLFDSPVPLLSQSEDSTNHTIQAINRLMSLGDSHPAQGRSIQTLLYHYRNAVKQSIPLGKDTIINIIALCGTLAYPTLESKFVSPLKYHFLRVPTEYRVTLRFAIINMVENNECGPEISLAELYWTLRAYLSTVQLYKLSEFDTVLDKARHQYMRGAYSDDPEFHILYLKFLLNTNEPDYMNEAIVHFCKLLKRFADLQPQFADFLWEIVLMHGYKLSLASKDVLLRALYSRLDWVPRDLVSKFRDSFVRTSGLNRELAAAFFPCYHTTMRGGFKARWAIGHSQKALALSSPPEFRWNNLVLLAASMSSVNGLESGALDNTKDSLDASNIIWRTTTMLANLDRHMNADIASLRELVQRIAQSLWDMYINAPEQNDETFFIRRIFFSKFFDIAAKTQHLQLFQQCLRASRAQGFWVFDEADSPNNKKSTADFVAAYGRAFMSCVETDWFKLYSSISTLLPHDSWKPHVTSALILKYSLDNVAMAYDLYIHALHEGIVVESVLRVLLRAIVREQRWDMAKMFLQSHPALNLEYTQLLLERSVQTFLSNSQQYVDPAYVDLLAKKAIMVYSNVKPSIVLQKPLAWFLRVMIQTGKTKNLVKLVQMFNQSDPSFLPTYRLSNFVYMLLARREFRKAQAMFDVMTSSQEGSTESTQKIAEDLRRNMLKFDAHRVLQRLPKGHKIFSSVESRRIPFRMTRRISSRKPIIGRTLRQYVKLSNGKPSFLREVMTVLIKARRFYTAKRLFAYAHKMLDNKSKTLLGNKLLSGTLKDGKYRNRNLAHRILNTKHYLVRYYGFTEDHITHNIVIHAILKWGTGMDSPKVKSLFNKMVRAGYPIPERFRRNNGVPFVTPHDTDEFPIHPHASDLSFTRHIRPLYKMFITAFYVRDDVVAAKTVVGILKGIEIENSRELEKRNQARRKGATKKRMQLATKTADTSSWYEGLNSLIRS